MGRSNGGIELRDIAYQPLPSQRKFHASTARFKGFSGPVGSGKSAALCHEAVRLSYLNAGRQGLIGAPTYPMLRDATLTAMLEIVGRNGIPYEYNKSENVLTLLDTKSRILFRSLDDFERLRGTNLAWFGVDELTYTAEEAWLRLEGRLRDPKAKRLCGFAVWTPKGFDWVYRRFVKDPPEGYSTVFARAYENRFVLDHVPDYYERLERSYDARFFAQEVFGEYLNTFADRVYHGFDREVHVRRVEVDTRLPLLWTLDFNVDPMCSLVAQQLHDEFRVIDEIVLRRASTAQACEEFLNRYPYHPERLVVYGDASGARMQTSGSTDYQTIRDALTRAGVRTMEFRVQPANPAVRNRVSLVNATFKPAVGDPRLFIDARCKELIQDLEEVSYKPDSVVIDKEKDPKRTHLSDALGYLVWSECRPKPAYGERGEPLV